ncbi:MBL fold metallo-hydrolase [Hamadaea sp. NPDC051192]|uniref:MBL fold metallo-hydrolase n=1 Tax=Hamadaea sp. NPDC051192 TaxID=3154940 RepID=UPI00342630CB
MRLTVVGCSGSIPGPNSACSSYLLEREGFRLLLDAGTGSAGPLLRYTDPGALDAVFISHSHGDHSDDLFAIGYHKERFHPEAPPIPVYGPDTLRIWQHDADAELRRVPEALATTRIGPFTVRLAPVRHTRETWAIRVDDRFCYTADSEPCAELEELAAGCDVVLAEAAGFDAEPEKGHLSAGDAGRLATSASARLLVITHLRPWHDPVALLAEAAAHARCPVVAATPGLRLSL